MRIVNCWEKVPIIFDIDYADCLTGVNSDNLKKLARNGEFPAFKVGKLWRVQKEDLKNWIDEQVLNQTVNPPRQLCGSG